MDNELISVIVPVYNTEKYLKKCLESILSQSFKELEIILVDDGSSDSSALICDAFGERDSRVRVFHRENAGVSLSRAFGLKVSRGNYVAFADSDDYMAPEMLEKLYRRMEEDKSALCVCEYVKVLENGAPCPAQPLPLPAGTMSGREAISLLGGDMGHQLVPMWNKLCRKEIFSDISFPGRMRCEDEMLIHSILYNCPKVSFLNEGLYFYLQRGGSITDSIDDIYLLDAASAFLSRSVFLRDRGLSEPALTAASGAVNLLYAGKIRPENKMRERELSHALKEEVRSLKGLKLPRRMRAKLFLLPRGKFIYLFLRRLKASFKGRAGQ